MNPRDVIIAKRNGGALGPEELEAFVRGFVAGEVADYQMSAFLMAVFLNGMTPEETAALTRIMVESGKTLRYPGLPGTKVDKHSTGGVGDLISLPLAPAVAACGVRVPMISGRGLGHTGGTLDKLESFGITTALDPDAFRKVLADVGFVMGGQTADLAPADRRMYALRDVTGTVESIPLIVSSILSKKVAEGIDALVLDVKCGRGAFMKTEDDARRLARELCRVGTLLGLDTTAFVTDMDTPLGTAIGNGIEAALAVDCLAGEGPPDTMELVGVLGAAMICLGGKAGSFDEARERLGEALVSGRARTTFRAMVEAQGGDPGLVDSPEGLPASPVRKTLVADTNGFLSDIDPYTLGTAVVDLGGGRRRADDPIDLGVGVRLRKQRGDAVNAGDVLAEILARDDVSAAAALRDKVAGAVTVAPEPPPPAPRIRRLITAEGDEPWNGATTWDRARRA